MASKQQRTADGDGPLPREGGPSAKRARSEAVQPFPSPLRVELNPADCDLDFEVGEDGLRGHALHEEGFAYCWSGARASVGMTAGKYCFGCKIISEQVVDMADTPSDQQHLCRVGISRGADPVGNLGETDHSFGFGGTGKFSNKGNFSHYGTKFGVGDTIVCAVDLESRPLASIGFSKNGQWLGIAQHFDATSRGLGMVDAPLRTLPWESALFPHVLLKNVAVQLQFTLEDGLVPEDGYKPWSSALADRNAIFGPTFTRQKECQVLMMVGLPASGKTTWAENWVKDHPEKRYILLGTNLALDQMKVPGLLRKNNYGERFERLMNRATGIFNTLLARAAKTPRNYIIDQTNVYKSARNRKLKAFADYHKVAVVIFPPPNELKFRSEKRFKEMGKEVPAEAINEMIANYVLPMKKSMPNSNEVFDEVIFPELGREEAERHLDEMKCALGSPSINFKRGCTPYSREGSIQSVSNRSVVSKEAASVPGDQCPSSQHIVLPPCRDSPSNQQVDPAYPWLVLQHLQHRSYSEYDRSLPYVPYGTYNTANPYERINREGGWIPPGEVSLHHYQRYSDAEAFRSPGLESSSPYGKSNSTHLFTPPSYAGQPSPSFGHHTGRVHHTQRRILGLLMEPLPQGPQTLGLVSGIAKCDWSFLK
uniref:SPRY domain-containing protein n=1 Tax=Ananas comosus var. bracteatus TaxID=296719 RepID=A0A6V7PMU6_ANACO|nr:unnamed protein product [Ananas comosus var. bracteatus]